ncbi:unnamed protein product, partial [marine sediment metagenome]
MAKKPTTKKKSTRNTLPSAPTTRGRYGAIARTGNKCVGEVCYNEEKNEIEIFLDKEQCDPSAVKDVVEGMLTG